MISVMAYEIVMHELAVEELESVRTFDRRRIRNRPVQRA